MITDMKAFVAAVREMREFQRAYFKAAYGSGTKLEALKQSKTAEKRVDELLAGQIAGESSLFAEESAS